MSEDYDDRRALLDKLQDNYRLVLQDDEDLREINAVSFSLLHFYIFISVVLLVIFGLSFAFIMFTPVKRLIPGYGDIQENSAFIQLSKKIVTLEEELEAQAIYTEGLRNMLTGMEQVKNADIEIEDGSVDRVKFQDAQETKKTKVLSQLIFAPPVKGPVSAEFDRPSGHFGVDIVAPKNAVIKSVMDGMVIHADWSVDAGNCIYVQHAKNIVSVYKHNSAVLVKTGEVVKTGQAIAIIGNSGELTSGPHLHFELWFDGFPVNPANYVNFN